MTTDSKFQFVMVLTIARFPLVMIFFAAALANVYMNRGWLFFAGFIALMLSAVTDLFDGYYARKLNVETRLGAHMDPLMDKFFYLSTLPLLVFVAMKNGHIGHATALLILTVFFLTRDQWVTFLRSIGSMYSVSGSANWSGKLRTCINLPLICGIYYLEEAPAALQYVHPWLIHGFEGIAFFVNVISVYVYTQRYWPYLRKSVHLMPPHDQPPQTAVSTPSSSAPASPDTVATR